MRVRPYPRYDGPATLANVRSAVRKMVEEAHGPSDHVVFIDSSHGNGDGKGSSYLCLTAFVLVLTTTKASLLPDPREGRDNDERRGTYWDHQLADDLSMGRQSRATTFVFLDAWSWERSCQRPLALCYSGGILEELAASLNDGFGTSTCSQKGYARGDQSPVTDWSPDPGYDESINQHGAWTNTFLSEGLSKEAMDPEIDLIAVFQKAYKRYTAQHSSYGDRPCCFLTHNNQRWNTNDVSDVDSLPNGIMTRARVFGN